MIFPAIPKVGSSSNGVSKDTLNGEFSRSIYTAWTVVSALPGLLRINSNSTVWLMETVPKSISLGVTEIRFSSGDSSLRAWKRLSRPPVTHLLARLVSGSVEFKRAFFTSTTVQVGLEAKMVA